MGFMLFVQGRIMMKCEEIKKLLSLVVCKR